MIVNVQYIIFCLLVITIQNCFIASSCMSIKHVHGVITFHTLHCKIAITALINDVSRDSQKKGVNITFLCKHYKNASTQLSKR